MLVILDSYIFLLDQLLDILFKFWIFKVFQVESYFCILLQVLKVLLK